MTKPNVYGIWNRKDLSGALNANKWLPLVSGTNTFGQTDDPRIIEIRDCYLLRTNYGFRLFDSLGHCIDDGLTTRHGLSYPLQTLRPNLVYFRAGGDVRKISLNESTIDLELLSIAETIHIDELAYFGIAHSEMGHVLTEMLQRFWFLGSSDESILNSSWMLGGAVGDEAANLLALLGISKPQLSNRVFFPDYAVVRIKVALLPSQATHLFGRYSSRIKPVWEKIRGNAVSKIGTNNLQLKKIFIDNNSHPNIVKDVLCRHNYTLIQIEKLTLEERIAAFASASAIAGFSGPSMHLGQFMQGGVLSIFADYRHCPPDYWTAGSLNMTDVNYFLSGSEITSPTQDIHPFFRPDPLTSKDLDTLVWVSDI
jgi:hypothetical protein